MPRTIMTNLFTLCSSLLLFMVGNLGVANAYDIVRDYSGQSFFNGWDFYGAWDNLTLGDAWYLDQQTASNEGLAYINTQGNAIIKVDNKTNIAFGQKRNSIRMTTHDTYDIGSLWIFDVVHAPYGCSVWPAIWSFGSNWPFDGEIDILENINLATFNNMALHTTPGCVQQPNVTQNGTSIHPNCDTAEGCTVREAKPNSYGAGFAQAGGGVWAVQFDSSGIFIWFWSRPDVPLSIRSANSTSSITDLSQWGLPSAAYPSSACDIPQFFSAQNLVLDITLCGDWAGVPSIYSVMCKNAGPTGICYNDMVVGPGSNFDNAYFEISHIRVYTTPGPTRTESPSATQSLTETHHGTGTTTISAIQTTITTTFLFGDYLAPISSTTSGSQQTGTVSTTTTTTSSSSSEPSGLSLGSKSSSSRVVVSIGHIVVMLMLTLTIL